MIKNKSARLFFLSLMMDKRTGFFAAILKILLFLLSVVYCLGLWLVKFLYKIRALKVKKVNSKVISIGNITLGGTGKTPCVEFVVKRFKEQDKKPAILIRGYGEDEHLILSRNIKEKSVFVGRDRAKVAEVVVRQYEPDLIILDDGFQHWRLHRDLDLVLIDAMNPFGNKKLIPRGILREPVGSLKRADIILLTKTDGSLLDLEDIKKKIKKANPSAEIFESVHKPLGLTSFEGEKYGLDKIAEQNILAVCGIADPEYFLNMLERLQARIVSKFIYPDHYAYTAGDAESIIKQAISRKVKLIVATQKDTIKIEKLAHIYEEEIKEQGIDFLFLNIELAVENEGRFVDRLYSVINS